MGSQPQHGVLNLLPWPRALERGAGSIQLSGVRFEADFDGVRSRRMTAAVDRLSEDLAAATGLPLVEDAQVPFRIHCEQPGGAHPGLNEDESYWLAVDDAGLFLDAATEWGVLRGLTTLGQLVSEEGVIPHVAVDDGPRFSWRGLLLDPARHFLPAAALKRTLDGMAACKMNVLHLHLSDDQGFRFPVAGLPELASPEAYSVAELEALVDFATERGIRIVPEIDMPGHVTSWLTAIPAHGTRQVAATDRFGVHAACLDPSSEALYTAIEQIVDALVAVFPDRCLHMGADEVSPGWWTGDPGVAELMHREELSDLHAVQAYFVDRVRALVEARGRQLVAWDEALHGGLSDRVIVQAWRGATARDRALVRGNRVVFSAPYYLDLNYPVDVHYGFDPAASQAELLAREDALLMDARFTHVAEGIRWTEQWRKDAQQLSSGEQSAEHLLLGAEACLWGELVTDELLDVRLWGRLPALAETFWSTDRFEIGDLMRRLDHYLDRLHPLRGRDLEGWTRAALDRLGVTGSWQDLALMLEPVKWYGRLLGAAALEARINGTEMPQSRPYGVASALNELADYLPPESRPARKLAVLCQQLDGSDPEGNSVLRRILQSWQALADEAQTAPAGLSEPARKLGLLADLIAARIDGEPADTDSVLSEICAPSGELMISVPPGLRDWLAC